MNDRRHATLENLTPVRTVTRLRALIDGFAARHAAVRVAGGLRSKPLLDCFSEMGEAARREDYDRFIAVDRKLHLTIVDMADVPGLADIWKMCGRNLERFRKKTIRECWPDLEMLSEAHRGIVDCVCAGAASAAENAARAHLDAIWYRLAEIHNDTSLPADGLSRACAYLAFHVQEDITLGFLARDIAKMSPGHLARLFRKQLGMSFTEYVRELRLKKAAHLLGDHELSVGHVAEMVGYRDGSRFARHFRDRFGHTPRMHRRRDADDG